MVRKNPPVGHLPCPVCDMGMIVVAAEFLKRLRAYEGCEGVSKVILEDRSDKDPDCNWDFSVIEAADAADPVAVGPAVIEVYGEMAEEFEMLTVH
jgi:hypothetical protein